MKELNATSLKTALWETLNSVKDGTMQPGNADAIAGCEAKRAHGHHRVLGEVRRRQPCSSCSSSACSAPSKASA
jgi:hypothetical protein